MNAAAKIDTKSAVPAGAPKARKLALMALGGVVVLALVVWTLMITVFAAPSESTDDAYVAGDVVAITSREAGTITALHADNTESVKRGQPLLDLDSSTADANLAAAEAELGRSVREVRSRFARVDEAQAEIVKASADLVRAGSDLTRRKGAATQGAVSGEDVDHADETVRTANAALALARSQLAEAEAAVQGASIETNPDVLAAIAAVRRAAIVRNHMHLTAPEDGIVAQRSVQLGQQVSPGAPLMAVVPLRRVWIDANFRETQLADLRVGQPATITSDAYGGHIVFHGKVLGLGAGSGNAFALLPPQNASGNWIKIVQRLPVRIGLDPQELDRNPLRIGLSVTVTVDTSDHAGPPVARAAAANSIPVRDEPGRRPASRSPDRQDHCRKPRLWRPVMTAAGTKPLGGAALGVTALALALGTFMQVLDSAIANVSLPTIAGNLGASTDDATWVITAFAAANGVTVPLTGWLMGRFGVVRTFIVSVTLFTLTSFLCGVATSLPMLVFFRLLQGGVSGPMIPGSQALLIAIFPEGKAHLGAGHLVDHRPGRARSSGRSSAAIFPTIIIGA